MNRVNELELQQQLSMLAQLYREIQHLRSSGIRGQSLDYMAEWFETAEPIFGESTPFVLELLNIITEMEND